MLTKIPLKDKQMTGDVMYAICNQYKNDLKRIVIRNRGMLRRLSDFPLTDYYAFCRAIPYKIDTKPIEVVGRPSRLVQLPKLDCKKKAVMIGSYASLKKIPFRFVAVSSRADRRIHHVFPELQMAGRWISYDATYADYQIGQHKPYTAREVL